MNGGGGLFSSCPLMVPDAISMLKTVHPVNDPVVPGLVEMRDAKGALVARCIPSLPFCSCPHFKGVSKII